MVSRYYLLNILLFTLLSAGLIAGMVLSWTGHFHPAAGIVLAMVQVSISLLFIRRMNVLNRQMAGLLHAIRNQDTAIGLPGKSRRRMKGELHDAFERLMDVLREQKFEAAAREQLLHAMIENSSTGFISIDAHGDFELMNQAARHLLGTRQTSNLKRLEKEFPALHKLLSQLKDGEADTLSLVGASGPSLVRVAAARLDFHQRAFTLISLQDIRREVNARELESWQKLIRILNHEIMNSIAPITSASRSLRALYTRDGEVLQEGHVDAGIIADTLDGLDIIETMGAGLQSFVENYRKLSRIPDPVRTCIDLEKWGLGLERMAAALLKEGDAELEIRTEAGMIEADEGLLNQVMLNLLRNALEAPDPPAAALKSFRRRVEILVGPGPGGKTSIRVRNNGESIPPGMAEQIFIPFFSTREKGAGIGLFLSRQIIGMHRGSLDAYTAPDGYTVFEILL